MKILIVDDSSFARRSTVKIITPVFADAEIIQAGGGAEAIELINSEKPDLVFLDLTMPEVSGIDVLEALQPLPDNMNIVVVTADVQKKTREKVFELGAFDMIAKPLNAEKLESITDRV